MSPTRRYASKAEKGSSANVNLLNASLAREKAFRQSGMFARKAGAPRCRRRRHQLRPLHLRLGLLLRTCHRPPHRCHHSVTTTIPRPGPPKGDSRA